MLEIIIQNKECKNMLKFITKSLKTIIIGILWSYIYLYVINAILIYIWNFSTFSANSWKMLNIFWESGGIIKTGKDYLLITTLLLLIPLWLYGWKKMLKINFLHFFLAPINAYNNYKIRKYGDSGSRIILHNMGTTVKTEESIEQMVKPSTPAKTDAEANKIRNAVFEKINSVKHK